MAIKKVTQAGQKVLRTKAKHVTNVSSSAIKRLVKDLADTMKAAHLIGIAAPQIGQGVRVFVSQLTSTGTRSVKKGDADPLRVFINPEIISYSKQQKLGWEGCGSIAYGKVFAKVLRPVAVTVRALNAKGEPFELHAKDLLARVIQHEFDHLNGVFFTDKMDASTVMTSDEYTKMMRAQKRKKKTKK